MAIECTKCKYFYLWASYGGLFYETVCTEMFCVSSGHSPVGSHLTNGEQDNTGSTHTHFGLTPPFCSLHHIHRIPETQPYFCDFQTKRPQIRRVKLWLFFVCFVFGYFYSTHINSLVVILLCFGPPLICFLKQT